MVFLSKLFPAVNFTLCLDPDPDEIRPFRKGLDPDLDCVNPFYRWFSRVADPLSLSTDPDLDYLLAIESKTLFLEDCVLDKTTLLVFAKWIRDQLVRGWVTGGGEEYGTPSY
jgi:hypothetical protein